MLEPEDGRLAIERPGFSYLPRFIHKEESLELIDYFAGLVPIWEQRHRGEDHGRSSGHGRRLTRPVYWLGAWQFACLGYYAEPDHRKGRCLRGERLPAVMRTEALWSIRKSWVRCATASEISIELKSRDPQMRASSSTELTLSSWRSSRPLQRTSWTSVGRSRRSSRRSKRNRKP